MPVLTCILLEFTIHRAKTKVGLVLGKTMISRVGRVKRFPATQPEMAEMLKKRPSCRVHESTKAQPAFDPLLYTHKNILLDF